MIGTDEALLGKQAKVRRAGAQWTGEIVAISHGPALLIEDANGGRVLVSMDGATIDLAPEQR